MMYTLKDLCHHSLHHRKSLSSSFSQWLNHWAPVPRSSFSGYKDVMSFSALPCLRWPIVHYWSFLQHWFAASHRPSSEEIARRMKVSGQANSAARKLGRVLLSAEALCAQRTQQKRTLSGLLEVDGIRASESLCFLGRQRCGTCSTLVRCSVAHARSTCTAWRMRTEPPPESFDRITKTEFASQVQTLKPGFGRTCLISDGAPAYLKLCPRMKLLHRACCHSKGQFVVQSRLHGQKLSVHTGGIDSAWKLCKAAVPSSVGTKTADGFNVRIDQYIRS